MLSVTLDFRDTDPDACIPFGRVPLFDLIRQICTVGFKADIVSLGVSGRKIEEVAVETDKDRKIFFGGGIWEVSAIGGGDQVD